MIHSNLLVVFKYSVFIMTDEGDSVLMVDNNFIAILQNISLVKQKKIIVLDLANKE